MLWLAKLQPTISSCVLVRAQVGLTPGYGALPVLRVQDSAVLYGFRIQSLLHWSCIYCLFPEGGK